MSVLSVRFSSRLSILQFEFKFQLNSQHPWSVILKQTTRVIFSSKICTMKHQQLIAVHEYGFYLLKLFNIKFSIFCFLTKYMKGVGNRPQGQFTSWRPLKAFESCNLFFCLNMCVHAKLLQSCLTLCDPVDCSLPDFSVHGILQARVLEWVTMPSSRGPSQPRDQTRISYVSCTGRKVLYHECHLGSTCL